VKAAAEHPPAINIQTNRGKSRASPLLSHKLKVGAIMKCRVDAKTGNRPLGDVSNVQRTPENRTNVSFHGDETELYATAVGQALILTNYASELKRHNTLTINRN